MTSKEVTRVSQVPLGLLSLDPIDDEVSLTFQLDKDGLMIYVRPFKPGQLYDLMGGKEDGQAEVLQYLTELGHVHQHQKCNFYQISHVVLKGEDDKPYMRSLSRSDQWMQGGDWMPTCVSIEAQDLFGGLSVDEHKGMMSSFTGSPNLIGFFIAGFRSNPN